MPRERGGGTVPKIFIIEDDAKIRQELAQLLLRYGYTCESSDDFAHIVEHALASQAQLILLDINLPYYDGYYICRELRKTSQIPIIMVTSRDSEVDELMSMNLGADDFIIKPYNTQILLARIASVLRRSLDHVEEHKLRHGDVTLDIGKSIITYGEATVELTKNECRILQTLFKNAGTIVSRDTLIQELWQTDEFIDDNTLTVNVNRLRKKLEMIGIRDLLLTRRGQGYLV